MLDEIAEALDARIFERAIEKALQRLRKAPDQAKDRRETIQRTLPVLEARMRTVLEGILRGYTTDTLQAELQALERRKGALVAELEALAGRKEQATSVDVERACVGSSGGTWRRSAYCSARTWRGRGRSSGGCWVDPLACEAFEVEDGRRSSSFTGKGSYADLLPENPFRSFQPRCLAPPGSAPPKPKGR